MILLCYHASDDARAAVKHAGELLGGQSATVLTVWEPFIDVLAHTSYGFGRTLEMVNIEQIDAANRDGAQTRAEEGAELARQAGLNAQPRARSQVTTVPGAILEEASEVGATAIVVGSRGLNAVTEFLLGSISHQVAHHSAVPVVIVPQPITVRVEAKPQLADVRQPALLAVF